MEGLVKDQLKVSEAQSSQSINIALDAAKGKIKAATSSAFDTLIAQVAKRKNAAGANYEQKKAAYDGISIPPKRYRRISYDCHKVWYTLWSKTECDHKDVQTSASIKARAKASALKGVAKGQMEGAQKKTQSFAKAEKKLQGYQTTMNSTVDKAFASQKVSFTAVPKIDTSAGGTQDFGIALGAKIQTGEEPVAPKPKPRPVHHSRWDRWRHHAEHDVSSVAKKNRAGGRKNQGRGGFRGARKEL